MKSFFQDSLIEAGCDEAGRGCLAGPVFAAAVILPKDFTHDTLTDSKQLSSRQRYLLRDEIKEKAIAWAVASCDNREIDRINILKASVRAMHKAVEQLSVRPEFLIIDGNYFIPYPDIPHRSIVKGDALYYSIAAASVLAKTCRDDYMTELASEYPPYLWEKNKGYPSQAHRNAIAEHGITPYHRRSFQLQSCQLKIPFDFIP
ncbi:MAG: ribonuclease HII [Bacteroidales bacterium]|jgi:ribonuclease HII|nr:ribonuclease HII [Bacteroidales bacterium]